MAADGPSLTRSRSDHCPSRSNKEHRAQHLLLVVQYQRCEAKRDDSTRLITLPISNSHLRLQTPSL
ncbi:Microtubule-associated TORTIFOLIA1-like protein [Gossypium australe]|uniref:Microtubule-associated TORTIFOLIA1-like protein n=1 Tax=Gossypium australe TaxID=47621 RepID=A0A5B6U9Z4_9ROSI|nr:Microtubule-associated TORTIFOLIA1-like protein [Gossypium australe]